MSPVLSTSSAQGTIPGIHIKASWLATLSEAVLGGGINSETKLASPFWHHMDPDQWKMLPWSHNIEMARVGGGDGVRPF